MKTRKFTLTAFFVALLLLFSFTPIGFIRLGFINATLVHIPVIIGSIVLGPYVGAFLGSIFGCASLFVNTTTPSLLSFAFSPAIPVIGTTQGSWWALVVCFIPRILVGIIPFYIFRWINRNNNKQKLALAFAGFAGSLTNTILVMGLIYTLFQSAYGQVKGISGSLTILKAVVTVVLVNGVPEAIAATFVTVALGGVLLKITKKS